MKPHKGQFQPGNRANPKGRPRQQEKAAALRKRIMNAAPEVIDGLIAAAKAGDVQAGRALLICACPPLKSAELPVAIPIDQAADLASQGRSVIAALAEGVLSPSQAAAILGAMGNLCRLIELADFDARLKALEAVEPGQRGVGPDWRALTRPEVVYEKEPLPE